MIDELTGGGVTCFLLLFVIVQWNLGLCSLGGTFVMFQGFSCDGFVIDFVFDFALCFPVCNQEEEEVLMMATVGMSITCCI